MNGFSSKRRQSAFYQRRSFKYVKPIAPKSKDHISSNINMISSIGQNNILKRLNQSKDMGHDNSINEPIIDTGVSNVVTVSSTKIRNTPSMSAEQIESFNHIDSLPFEESFSLKIVICSEIYDFTNGNENNPMKDTKTKVLSDLVQFFEQSNESKNLPVKFQLKTMKMIETNIYRPIPSIKLSPFLLDFSTVFVEPSWPQLFYVYQILNRVIVLYPNSSYFSLDFLKIIFYLTNMPDNNERLQLLAFLRSFYDTHQSMKMEIIDMINKKLIDTKDSDNQPFCISPLLIFFLHIYQRCYKQPPETFFKVIRTTVFQLVTSSFLPFFHQHMTSLLSTVFETGSEMVMEFFDIIHKYFPVSNSQKQTSFIELLLMCVSKMNPNQVNDSLKTILTIFINVITGPQARAADSVFDFFLSQNKEQWVIDQSKRIVPFLYDYFHEVSLTHWSSITRDKANNALLELGKLDRKGFLACKQKKPADLHRRKQEEIRQSIKGWQKVVHQIEDPSINHRETVAWIKDQLHYEKPA